METADGLIIESSEPLEPAAPDAAPPEEADAASAPAPESPEDDDQPVSARELRRMVGRFTRQRGDLERELAALKGQNETLMRLMQPQQPEQPREPVGPPRRPRQSEYATYAEYEEADEKFISDMVDYRTGEREGRQRQQNLVQQQQQQDQERLKAIQEREQELVKTHRDYYERFERVGPELAPHLLWALQQAGAHGPDLVLHLSDHPQEIQRLNQVPPHLIGIELGMLRGRPAQRSDTPAPGRLPEPPQPVNGTGGQPATQYREDWTQAQFDAWTKRQFPDMRYQQRR